MSKAPDFWWKPGLTPAAVVLAPFAWLYGSISGRRMLSRPKARSTLPVICIGNFVVGGTGKTPFAIELAHRLEEEGHKPGFLLRGYGGREKGPLLVDPDVHGAADVGDEALMLAQFGPTVVSANRPSGADLAEKQPIDVLLMDDGFQNPALAKDLSLALVDCAAGFGNGLCVPAGPLRAPVRTQILKADCLVLVGDGKAADGAVHLASRRALPILHAHARPQPNEDLEGRKLFAFAGIGRPQKFFASLEGLGYDVRRTRAFADHHPYSEAEVRALLTEAEEDGLHLVTTSKDMTRLVTSNGELFHWIASSTSVLDIRMEIDDEDRLMGLIREKLRLRKFSG
ncbi:tetraacyldisaccharide 4'-kinase [Roseibium aggregatum]|uniref:Tetraacyldisaccharide 4'-kinase n=1 Tax=Roseibium aggregatum TaxID=187304 RepID=A0A939EA23_9HYPH|nr:tetraacyldisaccharide 4'-kinase [Roseibium aggregatum]MBN9669108.1 tetraacyldisaccharide 4'-kinase [Roseibium aggregatum]